MSRYFAPDLKTELPNILLSTTYALNKSNSKRVCVGLEYEGGYYREVVQFVGCGLSGKYVEIDRNTWELLKEQFDAITAYLLNSYTCNQDSEKPAKVSLINHELDFTSSWGTKSILISEKPKEKVDHNSEEQEKESDDSPLIKRKKLQSTPLGIIMQYTTFEGLRKQSTSVDVLLDTLKQQVDKVNRTIDYILEYLREKLEADGTEVSTKILNNIREFKQYYSYHNADIEGFITSKLTEDNDNYKQHYLKIVLAEILAFGLPMVLKDLREIMFPNL